MHGRLVRKDQKTLIKPFLYSYEVGSTKLAGMLLKWTSGQVVPDSFGRIFFMVVYYIELNWTILDNVGPFWTILDQIQEKLLAVLAVQNVAWESGSHLKPKCM